MIPEFELGENVPGLLNVKEVKIKGLKKAFELITLDENETMADLTRKFDSTENYGYNFIHEAANCYAAARSFELRSATTENDKVIDELLIRRLRTMARDLMEQGMNQVKLSIARQKGEVDV